MAAEIHLNIIEEVTGYRFKDRALLRLSLTAAGAEEDNHEGNRRLAKIGDAVISLAIAVGGYEKAAAPAKVNDIMTFLSDKAYRARAASQLFPANCIKLSPRSRGQATKAVLSLALDAIIGAAHQDGADLDTIARIIKRLNLLCMNNSVVNPLSFQNSIDVPQVPGSACKELIDENWQRPPPIEKGKDKEGQNLDFADAHMTGTERVPGFRDGNAAYSLIESNITLPLFSHDETDFFFDDNVTADNATSHLSIENMVDHVPFSEDNLGSMSNPFNADEFESTLLSTEHRRAEQPGRILVQQEWQQQQRQGQIGIQNAAVTLQPVLAAARRKNDQRVLQTGDFTTDLQLYMDIETKRCLSHGKEVPQNTWLTETMVNDLKNFGLNKIGSLLRFYVGICSPETIATLRNSIVSLRARQHVPVAAPMQRMTIKERFAVIEGIGRQKAYLALTERLHIMKMYEDHSSAADQNHGWIHFDGQQHLRPSIAGNPLHSTKARIIELLVKEIFPNLEENAEDYRSKYAKVKRLRRLGERLHHLKSLFGIGVIGLIQCDEFEATKGLAMNISNQILLTPTDAEFTQFLALLKNSQGRSISQWSLAVTSVLNCVTEGNLHDVPSFPLERIEEHRILQLPKYSEKLHDLISQ